MFSIYDLKRFNGSSRLVNLRIQTFSRTIINMAIISGNATEPLTGVSLADSLVGSLSGFLVRLLKRLTSPMTNNSAGLVKKTVPRRLFESVYFALVTV